MTKVIRDQLIEKVSDYFQTEEAKGAFTAGELEGLIGAVGSDLRSVIGNFVDVMGPKSKDSLNKGDIKAFSKSIARSLIAVTRQQNSTFVYDEEKGNAALSNFKNLDKSKYDQDGKYIDQDILKLLKERKSDLRYHREFEPQMNIAAFSTQPLPEEISGNKALEEKTASLTAGVVAKLAGMSSPLIKNKTVNSGILSAAHDAAMDFIKENNSELSQRDAEYLIQLGKEVGKAVRDRLVTPSGDAKNVIKSALHRAYNNRSR